MPREALGNVLFSCNLTPPYVMIHHTGFWWGIGWLETRIGLVSLTSSHSEKGVLVSSLHALNQYGPRQEGCVRIKAVEIIIVTFFFFNSQAKE